MLAYIAGDLKIFTSNGKKHDCVPFLRNICTYNKTMKPVIVSVQYNSYFSGINPSCPQFGSYI